jgi:hypothetical protein
VTPRRASLRVAHQAACPNANATSVESLKGCKCQPSYYTFHRDSSGKPVKGPRVRDRQAGDRSLRKLQVQIDEGHLGHQRAEDRTFSEWAAEYLEVLAAHGRRDSNVRA